jgi:periplasmic protein TonB
MQFWQRFTLVTACTLALHAAVLWAVQAYAGRSSVASMAPALSTRLVEPPRPPEIKPPEPMVQPAPRAPEPKPAKTALAPKPAPAALPTVAPAAPSLVAATAPLPLASNNASPAANAPTGSANPAPLQPAAPSTTSLPVKLASPAVQLPSADVEHADNQYRAAYPKMSQRLGEEGRVLLRVTVGADGKPVSASVAKSSGSDHLDRAGIDTVMHWRFKPGTRGGVPEAMSVLQPVDFKLPS